MRSDPRIGLMVSLLICAAAALWLVGQWLAADAVWDALWPVLGYGTHAITLLDTVDPGDVRVTERRQNLRFTPEARDAIRIVGQQGR